MRQVIEWKGITDEHLAPHKEPCFFLTRDKEIVTGYFHHYDGKWVIVDPMIELTFKIPLFEFTHYAEVEE